MNASPLTWFARLLWLSLPLTLGEVMVSTLQTRSGPVELLGYTLAAVTWTAGLVSALVPLPSTLTVLRVVAPLPLLAGVTASLTLPQGESPSLLGWIGLVTAAVVAVVAMSAEIGDDYVNGASYGDERRMALRPPSVLLLGPIQLVWIATVAPLSVGLFLVAARQWVAGLALIVFGTASAWWGAQTMWRLARRWVVFVPAGVTIVDPLSLAEAVLFRRDAIVRLGPAYEGTRSLDLTAAATGLIVQIDLGQPVSLVQTVRRGQIAEVVETNSVLVAPSRPGAMLTHAQERHIAVQRA